jgi:hypothetical protein
MIIMLKQKKDVLQCTYIELKQQQVFLMLSVTFQTFPLIHMGKQFNGCNFSLSNLVLEHTCHVNQGMFAFVI